MLITYVVLESLLAGWSFAAEITASLGGAKVISRLSGAISIVHSLPQFMIPRALGVKRIVAYSPGSITSTIVGEPADAES